jgi:hypothetical protein
MQNTHHWQDVPEIITFAGDRPVGDLPRISGNNRRNA